MFSQDHIYELYHLLLSENPNLSRMYEFILSDIMQFVHRSKQIQKRLEKQIECERGQHSADILRLSEELDQQVLLAEESARVQEREQVLAEFRSQLESKSAQVEQLMERLKQAEENNIQAQEFSPKLGPSDHRLESLQNNLVQLNSDKARLEDLLTGTRAELVQTRTELTALRQNFKEKSREFDNERGQHSADILRLSEELDQQVLLAEESARVQEREQVLAEFRSQLESNHIAAFIEVVKENSQLKRQVSLLQEVNRELCDANDGLCAVLERSAEGVDKASTLREATTACSLLFTNFRQLLADFQIPLDSPSELNERTTHPLESPTSAASNISDRHDHIAAFIEVVKENSQLKRQVSLLQEVNRELCDANDGLCAVLERSAEGVDKASTLREATTACSLLFTNFRQLLADFQIPLDSPSELNERTTHPLESPTSAASNISDRHEFVHRPIPSRRKLKGFVFSAPLDAKQMSLSPDTFGESPAEGENQLVFGLTVIVGRI
ncbi:hypothetical protein AHF37_08839 [Paragonimus kellicotti]|nr:hypothetical protein AHF37_08839 [Paragonimus kellicotti]